MKTSHADPKTEASHPQGIHLRRRAPQPPLPLAVEREVGVSRAVSSEEFSLAQKEFLQQNEELRATRQALEAERWRYQELFQFAPDGYLVTDAEGIIREANAAATRMLRAPQSVLVGRPLVVFVAGGDRRALRTFLRDIQMERQPEQEWEVRLQPREGELFPAALTVAAVRDPHGNMTGVRWLLRDITQRKRAERALRENEARFRLVSQSISDYAFSFTIDDQGNVSVDWLTDSFTDVTGYAAHELLGKANPLCTHLHPDDLETVLRTVRTLQPGVCTTYQFRIITKNGATRWIQSRAQAVADASGRVIHFYGAARDITKEYETEQALENSEARYRELFDNASDAIATFTLDGFITNVNRAAAYLLGWEREEMLGRHFRTFATPTSAALAEERTRRFLAGEKLPSATFEVELVRKNGNLLQVEARTRALRDGDNTVVGFQGIYRDISVRKRLEHGLRTLNADLEQCVQARTRQLADTNRALQIEIAEHKQAEKALQESEERYRRLAHEREQQLILSGRRISFGELAASLAHEFNNPLGIILGFTQDMLKDVNPEHVLYRRLQIIEAETQRCKRLMQRLRDFARPAPMQLSWIDPAMVIRGSLELVATQSRHLRVTTALELPPSLPSLYADRQQLQQVLLNLFLNALEAMPHGGLLTVQARVTPGRVMASNESDMEEVVMTVADTGPGIPADALAQIFRPFFTTKTKEGMGLGLSICESIITAHGARMTVDSQVGHGTLVSLFFPVTTK